MNINYDNSMTWHNTTTLAIQKDMRACFNLTVTVCKTLPN